MTLRMKNSARWFWERVSGRHFATAMIVVAGLALGKLLATSVGVYLALGGGCPLNKLLSMEKDQARFQQLHDLASAGLSVTDSDPRLGVIRVASAERTFWIKQSGESMPGKELLAYLLTEHTWMAELNAKHVVKPGDIVIDCGAHVGVFTDFALSRGASRVVAIEPEPVNLECLRRNFAKEIAAGRVIVVPKGVWNAPGVLTLYLGGPNSGMNTMIPGAATDSASIEVPTTTIDLIVRDARLPRVDYIKMDIEGAEREALKGGLETMRRFRPVLMLDSYHREDDMTVLPRIIREAHGDYAAISGACEPQHGKVVPHVTFFRAP